MGSLSEDAKAILEVHAGIERDRAKAGPRSLEDLFVLLREAKEMVTVAKGEQTAIEHEIVAQIEDRPTNGSMTLKGGAMRCSVKFGMNYKANVDGMRGLEGEVADHLPLKHEPAKWVLDKKAYEALRDSRPDLFAQVAAHVTANPAKVGLTLKV